MSNIEQLEAEILNLPAADRSRLAERLLMSLEEDDEIMAAWGDEAERRADAFERGEIGAADFEDVMARARAGLKPDGVA